MVQTVDEIMGKNYPEKEFSTGAIKATVWKNEGKDAEGKPTSWQSVSFERRYKDKQGNWQSTNSLRPNDLPKAILVLEKAYEHVMMKGDSDD